MFTMPPSAAARKAAARATFLIFPPLSLNWRARRSKSTLSAKDIPSGQMPDQIRRRSASSGNGKLIENARRRTKASSRFWRKLVAQNGHSLVILHFLEADRKSRCSHSDRGNPELRSVYQRAHRPHRKRG